MPIHYVITSATIYRPIDEELVVIQSETGAMYHFSESTQPLLDFFSSPATLDGFVEIHRVQDPAERACLATMVELLVREKILEQAPASGDRKPAISDPGYRRPVFLKKEPRGLDEMTVSCLSPVG